MTRTSGGLSIFRPVRSRPGVAIWLVAFGVGVWLLARLGGVALKRPDLPGAAWWPAAGFAVVILLRTSRRWWPWLLAAVVVAVFVNNLQAGANLFSSFAFALANLVECVVTATLFRRGRGQHTELLSRGSDALRLSAAALCGVALGSGLVAVRGCVLGVALVLPTVGYAVSHCLGLLMFTPLLLLIPQAGAAEAHLRSWRVNAEWAAQLALCGVTAWWVFFATAVCRGLHGGVPVVVGCDAVGTSACDDQHRRGIPDRYRRDLARLRGGPFAAITDPAHRLWTFQLLLAAVSVAVLALALSAHARQKVTSALSEREASLDQAQQLAQLGSWRYDIATGDLSWSKEVFRIFGTDPATFRPSFESLIQLILPEDRDQVAAKIDRAKATGQPYEVDYRIRRPDGLVRAIHGRARTDVDRHGAPVQLSGVAQDVTDARAAEDELARARDLFAGVLNSATGQMIIGTDLQGLVTVFNVGAERILGYRAADMIGRLPTEIFEPTQIVDRAGELGIPVGPAVFVHALQHGAQAETRLWTYRTHDGRFVQIMLTATAMRDGTGAIIGYRGVGTDVTEQRRTEHALADSEQRFRLAFDTSSVGMYLVSLDPDSPGRILRANQAMAELVGVPVAELAGRTVLDITHPTDLVVTQANLQDMTQGERLSTRREKVFLHANGDAVWAQLSLSTVETVGERYVIALAEDITARKHAEDALRHQSLHDPLTGLANRSLFRDRLEHALAGSTRLTHATRPGDTVGRLGGDEFAILCPDLADSGGLHTVAERVLHTMNPVFPIRRARTGCARRRSRTRHGRHARCA